MDADLMKLEKAMALTSEAMAKLLAASNLIVEIHEHAKLAGDAKVMALSGSIKESLASSLAAFGKVA